MDLYSRWLHFSCVFLETRPNQARYQTYSGDVETNDDQTVIAYHFILFTSLFVHMNKYPTGSWLVSCLLILTSERFTTFVSCCSLKQNTGDLRYKRTAPSASRSSTGCCRKCTTFQALMCYWAMLTSMETCFPSTMMTTSTKRCLPPILCWGSSSRGEVRKLLRLRNTKGLVLWTAPFK